MKRCSIATLAATPEFRYVAEQDSFLALFPHRFDFIYAEHPEPGQSPSWETERRYPLSDRMVQQGGNLYGVRFGSRTQYCLLDIDTGSFYHPQRDPLAIGRIMTALESIGLVSYLACTSSYSSGIHLYLPFTQSQSSWELAIGLATLLENSGFKLKPGQLEIFPNPKPYSVQGKPTLFNAHRLPLQIGSYLLDSDFQPIWSDRSRFVDQWQLVQSQNDLNKATLKQILKQAKRKQYRVSGRADKFLNDLNTEIEQGWTDHGQTNRLLGRIAMRTYIFHHLLHGGEPLTGQALVNEIVAVARSLPGYKDWCRHQHEIEQRAIDWARCIESSHYFHYTNRSTNQLKTLTLDVEAAITDLPSWNQQQSESARERIKCAIVDLLEKNALPATATARFSALTQYGIGGGSLYRHRDLWHPKHLVENQLPVENPPHPLTSLTSRPSDCLLEASNGLSCTSLFPGVGGNVLCDKASSDRTSATEQTAGSNSATQPVLLGHAPALATQVETQIEANKAAFEAARAELIHLKQQAYEQTYHQQIQQYLASGDSILIAEAQSRLQSQPTRSLLQPIQGLTLPLPRNPLTPPITPPKMTKQSQSERVQEAVQLQSDLSELLVAISVQLKRLHWTKTEICDRLDNRYQKNSRSLLSETELWDWLTYLQSLY